ncbi:hypothetical protein ACFSUS_14590 [Spirosoma soli]|uniref:Globin domain-containing protein n=1 Tax=Spirosoma soli TaxID=1770529 RepID=A0ABW5M5A3_9BACT
MTEEQITLVQRTWRLLRPIDPQLLSNVFLTRLELEGSSWRPLASFRLKGEAAALIDEFSMIIARLNQPEATNIRLLSLATHYLPDVISPQQILYLGRALMWTIQQALGTDWTPEVEQAWRQCYFDMGEILTRNGKW